jgi:hypothetical protein
MTSQTTFDEVPVDTNLIPIEDLRLEADSDNRASGVPVATTRAGGQAVSTTTALRRLLPAQRARIFLLMVYRYGSVTEIDVDFRINMYILALFASQGVICAETLGDENFVGVEKLAAVIVERGLNNAEVQVDVDGKDPKTFRLNPATEPTIPAAAALAALVMKILLCRMPYDHVKPHVDISLRTILEPFTNDQKSLINRFIPRLARIRSGLGPFALESRRASAVYLLAVCGTTGHTQFRRRINAIYRHDIMLQYVKRQPTPLLERVWPRVDFGEVPQLYAGLIHLIPATWP